MSNHREEMSSYHATVTKQQLTFFLSIVFQADVLLRANGNKSICTHLLRKMSNIFNWRNAINHLISS